MRRISARSALSMLLSLSLTVVPLSVLAAPTSTEVTLATPPLEAHIRKEAIQEVIEVPIIPAPLIEGQTVRTQYAIPENTTFTASLTAPLLSRESVLGDKFELVLDHDLKTVDGRVAIPKGSMLHAEVKMLKGSKLARIKAQMAVAFYEVVTPNGQVIPIEAEINTKTGYLKGNRRRLDKGSVGLIIVRQAIKTGVQLAAGAAAGYGAGIALFVVVKRGKDVIYKPGEKLPIKLVKPAQFETVVSLPAPTPEAPVTTGSSLTGSSLESVTP